MHDKLVIAIEGVDMTGKATQSDELARALRVAGHDVSLVEVPWVGAPRTHSWIYGMLASGAAKRWPTVFQALHALNKWLCQRAALKWSPRIIVFDRWHLSSVVYGTCSGLPRWLVKLMGSVLVQPDVTVVLSKRAERHARCEQQDTYESDASLQERAARAYEQECDGRRVILVDADGTVPEVADRVKTAISRAAIEKHVCF